MSATQYSYDLKKVVPLHHLPQTVLTISVMKGLAVSDKTQYYVNTSYLLGEDKRNGQEDHGLRRTKGFSVQSGDIPALIAALTEIQNGALKDTHLFPCTKCTGAQGKMIFHRRQSADAPEACPKDAGTHGDEAYSIE